MLRFIAVLSFLACTALRAHAQDPLPVTAQANLDERCRRVKASLEQGSQGSRPDRSILTNLHLCPGGASNFAEAVQSLKSTSDTAVLSAVAAGARSNPTKAGIGAAIGIAGDPRASTAARVFAIGFLVGIQQPGVHLNYATLAGEVNGNKAADTGVPVALVCQSGMYRSPAHGPDVPADLRTPETLKQISNIAERIYRDTAEPELVRSAAACLR